MRKSVLFGGSILCLFILVSLSYQPIIAETPIESKASNLDVDEIKELYNRLIEIKSQSDCGCEKSKEGGFPIICLILFM